MAVETSLPETRLEYPTTWPKLLMPEPPELGESLSRVPRSIMLL